MQSLPCTPLLRAKLRAVLPPTQKTQGVALQWCRGLTTGQLIFLKNVLHAPSVYRTKRGVILTLKSRLLRNQQTQDFPAKSAKGKQPRWECRGFSCNNSTKK